MCGIAGVIDDASSSSILKPLVRKMTDSISHRGPDSEGFFVRDGIGLGMRRLSIIDLISGEQPIYNEDRSVVVVYNGEIYNYLELRKQLIKRGHKFATKSDTEVLVHLYEEYGEECTHHLRGMFAFAIWEKEKRNIFIARDRLGIKPLYYTHSDNRLIFASEIKAILQHPDIEALPNKRGLSNFLSLKYVPAPQTMFEGIYALPPGYTLSFDHKKGLDIYQYWDISFRDDNKADKTEQEYCDQLEALLKEAIQIRLMSDVPFGAFLSGGVDSSTIVALMSHFLDEPVKTFSVGYKNEGKELSELPYARLVAQKYNTDHHEILVSAQDFINLAEKVVWHLDQPIADQAALATYMLSGYASNHVKMVLTGEGGDELFAGYARYAGERFSPLFQHIPGGLKKTALAMSEYIPGLRRPKLALYALCQKDELSRYTNWFPLANDAVKATLLTDGFKNELGNISASPAFAEHLEQTDAIDSINRMLYVDSKLWLPDDLLARGDKTSMAASIEARVPILDHKLVEFAASLPVHLKLNRLKRKYLLREASKKWLPPEIINRKKKGFPMPVSTWFRHQAREFVQDILAPTTIRKRNVFIPNAIDKILRQHESGFADHGTLIWALINIELWYRLYIDA